MPPTNLHFHRGCTCHGSPTLAAELRYALSLGEELDIVQRRRDRFDMHKFCYSALRLSKRLGYRRITRGRIVTRIRHKVIITGRRK